MATTIRCKEFRPAARLDGRGDSHGGRALAAAAFALEYKLNEPRIRSFQARAADTLLMVQEIGLSNVGVCIDVGHAFLAQENVAESAWLLNHYGQKMFRLHYNDNYGHWHDDMIVGRVHVVHYVELHYWLKKSAMPAGTRWTSIRTVRTVGRAVSESVAFLRDIEDTVTANHSLEINRLLATGDATASTRWLRNFIFSNRAVRA